MINVRINNETTRLTPRIMVVGVGGAGGNAVDNMIRSGLEGCEFLVCNTDSQALQNSLADKKIQLGTTVTQGLGAGARPDVGRAAAEESIDEIISYLEGSNMVFVTCGMGGGTGTGAAAVIARAARDLGILTVGVATKPFHFEGATRMRLADEGLTDLQSYVDTLIVIPNQNLFRIANEKTSFSDAFKMADDVLQSGVRGVTDLIVMPGLINLDFADIKSVMGEMGKAMMGTGEASGERRALDAAESAISNPLLDDVSMKGAKGVLINITGGHDISLFEVDEAVNRVREEVDPDANIIFGSTFDDNMTDQIRISVVATGIDQAEGMLGGSNTGGYTAVKRPDVNTQTTSQATTGLQNRPATTQQTNVATQGAVNTGIRTQGGHHIPAAGTPYTAPTQQAQVQSDIVEQAQATKAELTQPQVTQTHAPAPYTTGTNIPAYQNPVAQQAVPAQSGQRLQGAFIPPKAMSATTETQSTVSTNTQTVAQTAPVETTTAKVETAEETRTPTLFERLTQTVTSRIRETEETNEPKVQPSLGGSLGGSMGGTANAPQGSLGIDTAPKDEGDLDIPAFLRRQAN